MKVLVTGAAGFIGSYMMRYLASRGDDVTGIDNINGYYDTRMKLARLRECGIAPEEAVWDLNIVASGAYPGCRFIRMSIEDKGHLDALFARYGFDTVVSLAAQAGVRYSTENPFAYMSSNIYGFLNILECCRRHGTGHLVYASSSSVYGTSGRRPFAEDDSTDAPESLYAASKKADELMAHSYSRLYGLRTTGLRYFTVYGPWGRPDMAPMLFADAITAGKPIRVFNGGDMTRDFTYIDDVVEATARVIDAAKGKGPEGLYGIYNVGCSRPVSLLDFIGEMETAAGRKAVKVMMPMQKGDVRDTFACTARIEKELGYAPRTCLREGMARFMEWYRSDKNPLRQI